MKYFKGFTLIELLVVIAIIALLLAIVMPALRKAKDLAMKIDCSANLHSLALAAIFYADEHDALTPSSTNYWEDDDNMRRAGWCGVTGIFGSTTVLPIDEQIYGNSDPITGLQRGQLWPYIETIESWRCPADPAKEQLRSYCMSAQWWGQHTEYDDSVWYDTRTTGMVCRKFSKVKGSGNRFMFVDQLGYNTDAYAALRYSEPKWWNIPNFLHSGGNVNGFADGHVESYKLDSETIKMAEEALEDVYDDHDGFRMPQVDLPDSEDLKYYQRATWGKLGW